MTSSDTASTNNTDSTKYIHEFTDEEKEKERNILSADEVVAAIVAGQEVRIRNAIITGPFELDSRTVNAKLTIQDSIFQGPFDASHATFKHVVSFKGSIFGFDCLQDLSYDHSVTFRTAVFEKELIVEKAIFKGKVDVTNANLFEFLGDSAQFEREVIFDDITLTKGMHCLNTIYMGDLTVSGKIGGIANFSGVQFTNAEKTVNFNFAQIEGDVFFSSVKVGDKVQATIFAGGADFTYMRVGGGANFQGVQFTNEEKTVSFNTAQIAGNAWFSSNEVQTTIFAGEADFGSMRVGGRVYFQGVQFTNEKKTVSFEAAQVKRDAIFDSNEAKTTTFAGGADFAYMRVGGVAEFQGVQFTDEGKTVSFHAAQIEGNAFFNSNKVQTTIFAGKADFAYMRVGGVAEFQGVQFTSEKETVSFHAAQIEGNALFSSNEAKTTTFTGGADFAYMRVGGRANFEGVQFTNKSKTVTFNSARFERNMYFSVNAFGDVSLESVHIGQMLDLTKATFSRSLVVKDAHIGVIDFGQNPTNLRDITIDLLGTHYGRIVPDTVWKQLTDSFDEKKYDRQPFTRLENTFREAGKDHIANEVYIKRQKFEASQVPWSNVPRRFVNWFLWFFTDYGVHPAKLWIFIFIIWGIGFLLFMLPGSVIVDPEKAVRPGRMANRTDPCAAPLSWQDAALVSMNTFLPVKLPIDDTFKPSFCPLWGDPNLNFVFRFVDVANIMVILGWILIPVGIASLTGLLKR
jgi:uncharacterized protein YhbP (UPF0306 family)